jgi:hypothetical protein
MKNGTTYFVGTEKLSNLDAALKCFNLGLNLVSIETNEKLSLLTSISTGGEIFKKLPNLTYNIIICLFQDATWTSGAAYCSSSTPLLIWCATNISASLPQLKNSSLWWDSKQTEDANNGLALNPDAALIGKAVTSLLQYVCQVILRSTKKFSYKL